MGMGTSRSVCLCWIYRLGPPERRMERLRPTRMVTQYTHVMLGWCLKQIRQKCPLLARKLPSYRAYEREHYSYR